MREYGTIYTRFWTHPTAQGLPDQTKLLAVYLLSSPHTTMLGCFRLPMGYIMEDLKWTQETVEERLMELSAQGFLTFDAQSGWLVIPTFLKWNPIENPNQGRSIAKLFEQMPEDSPVLKPLIVSLQAHGKYLEEGFTNRLETLLKRLGNPLERVTAVVYRQPEGKKALPADTVVVLKQPDEGCSLYIKPCETLMKPFDNPFGTVSEPFRNQEQEQEQDKDPEQEQNIVAPARPGEGYLASILGVFNFWKATLGHPQAVLDDKRKALIRHALKSGYTPDQLCEAIVGCSLTPHNMGKNDRGQRYDGLHVILKDADQIDRFIHNAQSPPRERNAAQALIDSNLAVCQEWLQDKLLEQEVAHEIQ